MQTTAHDLIGNHVQLSAGVLSADLLRLGEEIQELEQVGIRLLHVDVMDGVFCPAMTVGPPLVQALPEAFIRDVHLMIDRPEAKLDAFVEAGADIISFHVEATRHPHQVLRSLAGTGIVRGIALNPGTPIETVFPLLDEAELVLVLAVNPGFPNQHFATTTEGRLRELRKRLDHAAHDVAIAVDGGVTAENVASVAGLGVDLVVAGSAVFRGDTTRNALAMAQALESVTREPVL